MPIPTSPEQPPGPDTFPAAAERLLRALSSESGFGARSADFRSVTAVLARFVSAFGVSAEDADEVAQEAVIDAHRRGLGAIANPGAFLFWTARNRAIDWGRRSQRTSRVETLTGDVEDPLLGARYSAEDDAIAAIFEDDATAEMLELALTAANAAGDSLVSRVVGAWLEVANQTGKAPTSREVAEKAALSHTSVNQALRRFRNYFPDSELRSS